MQTIEGVSLALDKSLNNDKLDFKWENLPLFDRSLSGRSKEDYVVLLVHYLQRNVPHKF